MRNKKKPSEALCFRGLSRCGVDGSQTNLYILFYFKSLAGCNGVGVINM